KYIVVVLLFIIYMFESKDRFNLNLKGKCIALVTLIGFLILIGNFVGFFYIKDQIVNKEIKENQIILNNTKSYIVGYLNNFERDVITISNLPDIEDLVSFCGSYSCDDVKKRIQKTFVAFAESYPEYMQVRYIDEIGNEIVRVDRDDIKNVRVIDSSHLQNKSNRYYFKKSIDIPRGKVYISELDLNIEFGEIERPLKPTIRYATPVFDVYGNNKGVIVLNIAMKDFLGDLKLRNRNLSLIDQGSYFIVNSNSSDMEWGELLGTNFKFDSLDEDYVTIKENLRTKGKYFLIDNRVEHKHLETYLKIGYDKINPDNYWVLVKTVPFGEFYSELNSLQRIIFTINIIVIIIFMIIFIFFSKSLTGPILEIDEAIKKIDSGDYNFNINTYRRDEIGNLIRKFNEFVVLMREQDIEKRNFITSASHQFRTPSTGVGFQLQNLKKEIKSLPYNSKILIILEEIILNNRRALGIANDLFKILELGEKYVSKKHEDINVKYLVNKIIDSFSSSIDENNLKIDIDISDKLIIRGEEVRLKNAFLNIIENAILYSNEMGKVSISAKKKGNKVHFIISDEGIGIPKNEQINIFNKFFRASNSYVKSSVGTGLGLVVSKIIISGHKGKIWIESEEGLGTKVYITLPVIVNNLGNKKISITGLK
ncbi:ATP-binding protein, partial [Patescibacteria group bacterium]